MSHPRYKALSKQDSKADSESIPMTAQWQNNDHSVAPETPTGFITRNGQPTNEYYNNLDETSPALTAVDSQHGEIHNRDRKLKKIIRGFRLVLRSAATGIAIGIAIEEGKTLYTYQTSHDVLRITPLSPLPRGPWAVETQLWSSILLFSIAVLTAVLGSLTLVAYLTSVKCANKVSDANTKVGIAAEVLHILGWIAAAATYREAKAGEKDLWGWACGAKASQIQGSFEGVVDFRAVCGRSAVNYGFSIANAVVQALGLVIWALVWRREKTKRMLEKAKNQESGANVC